VIKFYKKIDLFFVENFPSIKGTKCPLPDGRRLMEGDFSVEEFNCHQPGKASAVACANGQPPALQRAEIVSCLRQDGAVRLQCTGTFSALLFLNSNGFSINHFEQTSSPMD
jgi:hypothetical protein